MIIYDADGVHEKKLETDIAKKNFLLSSFMLATDFFFCGWGGFYQPFSLKCRKIHYQKFLITNLNYILFFFIYFFCPQNNLNKINFFYKTNDWKLTKVFEI